MSSSSRVSSGLWTFRVLTGSFAIPSHPSFQSSLIRSFVFIAAGPGNSECLPISLSSSNTAAFNAKTSRRSWSEDEYPNFV